MNHEPPEPDQQFREASISGEAKDKFPMKKCLVVASPETKNIVACPWCIFLFPFGICLFVTLEGFPI